jgi:hypothetical protein
LSSLGALATTARALFVQALLVQALLIHTLPTLPADCHDSLSGLGVATTTHNKRTIPTLFKEQLTGSDRLSATAPIELTKLLTTPAMPSTMLLTLLDTPSTMLLMLLVTLLSKAQKLWVVNSSMESRMVGSTLTVTTALKDRITLLAHTTALKVLTTALKALTIALKALTIARLVLFIPRQSQPLLHLL